MLGRRVRMPEFQVWIFAGICILLAVIVAAFGGKKKVIDSIITVISTFIGVFAGLAINSAHERAARESKANNVIRATMIGIHESVRPYAKLLEDFRVLSVVPEPDEKIRQYFVSAIQGSPLGTPIVMTNFLSSPEIIEFVDESVFYRVVDDTVKMNLSSNAVNNAKTDAVSGYNTLKEFAGYAGNAYKILCMQLKKEEGTLDKEASNRLQSDTTTEDDVSKVDCNPQWTAADLINKILRKAGSK
jgi:hypothetical protein